MTMTNKNQNDFVINWIKVSKLHSGSHIDNSKHIQNVFNELLSTYYDIGIDINLICCRTLNKYSNILPVKTNGSYSYYLVYDQYLDNLNYYFNLMYFSNIDIEHDLWKLSYELFAEEALINKQTALATYYGIGHAALGPFNILSEKKTKKIDFINAIQKRFIISHELGHCVYARYSEIINKKSDFAQNIEYLYNKTYDILNLVYKQYLSDLQPPGHLEVIKKQNDIIHQNNSNIIEECFADALSYTTIFSYLSAKFKDNFQVKLDAVQAILLVLLNVEMLAIQHANFLESSYEHEISIRINFFRNYADAFFKDVDAFDEIINQTEEIYGAKIVNPILDCFTEFGERKRNINNAFMQKNGEYDFGGIFGLPDVNS